MEILQKFEEVISGYDKLLGYNSTRFDESFIVERCRKYKFNTKIKSKKHIDMYLTATKAKCLLNLPNYKQKTIEEFLGLHRDDKYNGGELIPVYQQYSLTGDEQAKELILLHNFEDVKGMIFISDILSYSDLLSSDFTYISHSIDEDKLRGQLRCEIALPNQINKLREYGMYIIKNDILHLTLNLYSGQLYTYLSDYKNYYYLIEENMIIPKALGESIDKNNRRPAKRADCKVSLEGTFIQLPEKLELSNSIHIFKESYESKDAYVNVADVSEALLIRIAKYMLKH